MQKLTVNGREYEIMVMPPYCAPLARRLGNIVQQQTSDLASTKAAFEEAKQLTLLILAETVRPDVETNDIREVYEAVVKITNEANSKAELFRGPSKRDRPAEPHKPQPDLSQKTERDHPTAPEP